jgi:hypothetical protein
MAETSTGSKGKQSWDIIDFSGGFNSAVDKRDIDVSESAFITDLISYNSGSLKLEGVFDRIDMQTSIQGIFGMTFPLVHHNWSLQPSSHFIVYGKGSATASNSTTVTITSANHALRQGAKIVITKGSTDTTGLTEAERTVFRTVNIDYNSANEFDEFTITWTEAITVTNVTWYWVLGAENLVTDTFTPNSINALSGTGQNKLILKAAHQGTMNKFGFYDIADRHFYGKLTDTVQAIGTDSWFFDTTYLWNENQSIHPSSNVSASLRVDSPVITSAFYFDGVFRINETPPIGWSYGFIRKPVGLYYIEKHVKFENTYYPGWYPLISFILSPTENRMNNTNWDNVGWNQTAGKITVAGSAEADIGYPIDPHMVWIGLSEEDGGEWDFNLRPDLSLGMSLVYDHWDHDNPESPAQESNISWLTDDRIIYDGTNGKVTVGSGANQKLKVGMKIRGSKFTNGIGIYDMFGDGNDSAIPSCRGSQSVAAFGHQSWGNKDAWNPRIQRINIWIMEDSDGIKEDPVLLTSWIVDEPPESTENFGGYDFHYLSKTINFRPEVLSYNQAIHGYSHTDTIHAWYKTSAIVNRRLFAGNVSYYEPLSSNLKQNTDFIDRDRESIISNYPDRILYSPINRFDILPINNLVEIALVDGQDIVKLESFNNYLMVYKTSDLFIFEWTIQDESPVLIKTLYGKGVLSDTHVIKTDNYIYSMNKNGIYAFDGESIQDVILNKIDPKFYDKNVYNTESKLIHDPKQNLLMITSKYDSLQTEPNSNMINNGSRAFIINLSTGGLFFKNNLVTEPGWGDISEPMIIDGQLYVSARGYSNEEQYSSPQTTALVVGSRAIAYVDLSFTNSGTNPGPVGGTCLAGQISDDIQYIKVKRASDNKWVNVNAVTGFTGIEYKKEKAAATASFIETNNLLALKDYIQSNMDSFSAQDDQYYVSNCILLDTIQDTPTTSGKIRLTISANILSANLDFVEADLSGINTDLGTTAIGLSDDTTESTDATDSGADIQIGNIDEAINYNQISTGITPVSPIWTVSVNRNSNITVGTSYVIRLSWSGLSGGTGEKIMTFNYVIGESFSGIIFNDVDDYTYTVETGGDNNVNNDNLITNIREALYRGILNGTYTSGTADNQGNHFPNDLFTLSAVSGSSGSKSFTISLTNEVLQSTTGYVPDSFSIETYTEVPQNDTAAILQWKNMLPLDQNDVSLYTSDAIDLQTKDIDFDSPSMRKKVYRAHVTYTGGNGNILCQYQANQSGTWTDAVVYDSNGSVSTNSGRLNSSTYQTRAEITFGTGGNNIYSFALRFRSSGGSVDKFEINDICITYRLKSVK